MKLKNVGWRLLSLWVLGLPGLPVAWAQTAQSDNSLAPSLTLSAPAAMPAPVNVESLPATSPLPSVPGAVLKLEQVWDVAEVMGRPMEASARQARLVIKGTGILIVDGGCNYFTGRLERNTEGAFRVSRYSGTHDECASPSRSEAVLNSALVMVNNYRADGGLVLRSGDSDLIRLVPSANQDSAALDKAFDRAKPAPKSNARSARAGKPGKKGAKALHSVSGKSKAHKGAKAIKAGKSGKGKSAKAGHSTKKTSKQ